MWAAYWARNEGSDWARERTEIIHFSGGSGCKAVLKRWWKHRNVKPFFFKPNHGGAFLDRGHPGEEIPSVRKNMGGGGPIGGMDDPFLSGVKTLG